MKRFEVRRDGRVMAWTEHKECIPNRERRDELRTGRVPAAPGREDLEGGTRVIRITLKGVPPSLNRYLGKANGQAYRQAKAEWTDTVAWMAKRQRKQHRPYDHATVRIKYYFPDRRRRDPDNYCGKLLLDGLREAGIIVDDSFNHIRLELSGGCDPGDPRTEIEVEEETDG